MYHHTYGLARPFSTDGIAQNEAIFRTRSVEVLVDELGVALNRRDSIAVLHGNSGTGKSTIAHAVLKDLDTCMAFAALVQRPLNAHELLEQILSDYGCEISGKSHVERKQIWRQFICEAVATDTRVCLLVEDAEDLDTAVLKSLHQLTVADAQMSPGCNIILNTRSESPNFPDHPELASLGQRIRLRRKIEPLTASEVDRYLDFKCGLAKVERARLFAADVAPTLHQRTGGVIRVIDNLLESALASAAASHGSVVTAACITGLADEQFGLRPLEPAEINELLDEYSDTATIAAEPEPNDIPTLLEYVPSLTRKEKAGDPPTEFLLQLRQY